MSTLGNNIIQKSFGSFGEALDYAIDKRKISQSELAELVNKNRSQISKWVSGMQVPSRKSLHLLSSVLFVDFLQDNDKWLVKPSVEYQVEQYADQLNDSGTLDTSRGQLTLYIQGRLKSLSIEIQELSELLGRLH